MISLPSSDASFSSIITLLSLEPHIEPATSRSSLGRRSAAQVPTVSEKLHEDDIRRINTTDELATAATCKTADTSETAEGEFDTHDRKAISHLVTVLLPAKCMLPTCTDTNRGRSEGWQFIGTFW